MMLTKEDARFDNLDNIADVSVTNIDEYLPRKLVQV